MLVVGFVGLPSAGKSTMINALAGKRVLESGVCRTTKEVFVVGSYAAVGAGSTAAQWVQTELKSDDGVEFCAVDLPGICDAEDDGAFDVLTVEWASKCDVVVWVTDARTAFLTKHESAAVARIREAVQQNNDEDGSLHQFLVVLSKYDEPVATAVQQSEVALLPGEIRSPTEDSSIAGRFESAVGVFPRVAKFNAFARIARCGSDALRRLAGSGSGAYGPQPVDFELLWATENIMEKRFAQMSRVLLDTRRRAMAALAPRYEMRVQFHFAATKAGAAGAALTSVGIMVDRAASSWLSALISSRVASVSFYGGWSMGVRYTPNAVIIGDHFLRSDSNTQQIVAPTVRPVFGDVYIIPAVLVNGPMAVTGRSEQICIYTGREAGDTYVLKVGEASHSELHSLAVELRNETRCPNSGDWARLVDVIPRF
jgi:hypothetical protein